MTLRFSQVTFRLSLASTLLFGGLAAVVAVRAGRAEEAAPLKLVGRIPLPGVAGRIDHLALDSETGRLFVAALGNDTVEIVDLANNRRTGRIDGLREPQGVLFLSSPSRLFVTNGEDASLSVFQGGDLGETGRIPLRDDPDNIRFEADAKRAWVGEGGGSNGALAAIDPDTRQVSFEIPLDGHPESFQLEATGPRIFVNVPSVREVEVIDRQRREVVAKWKLPHASNFPMAIDRARDQILVGCRRPPRILALDAATGHVTADVPAPGDVDDIFIDPSRRRVYVSGGEGLLRVYSLSANGGLEPVKDVPTGPGARTCLFDPSSGHLYVAVPREGTQEAEILVFLATR